MSPELHFHSLFRANTPANLQEGIGWQDEALRWRTIQDGAVECLFRPLSDAAMQGALDLALKRK
jgi:hypothetical protein